SRRSTSNSFYEIASSHCLPQGLGPRQLCDYSRDLRRAKRGSGFKLHSSNSEPPMSALGQKQTAYLPTGCPDAPIGCPYWRAHRYARVAKTPSNVRMACSFPHNISKARDCGPASVVGIASSLWFVGIMPMRV